MIKHDLTMLESSIFHWWIFSMKNQRETWRNSISASNWCGRLKGKSKRGMGIAPHLPWFFIVIFKYIKYIKYIKIYQIYQIWNIPHWARKTNGSRHALPRLQHGFDQWIMDSNGLSGWFTIQNEEFIRRNQENWLICPTFWIHQNSDVNHFTY